jgi:ketosteroid isomerase-like protein
VTTASSSTTEQNKKAVAEFLEVFSTGDVDGIAERMRDDATWWVGGTMEGLSGTYSKEEMRKLLSGVTTVYKGGALRITPVSMIAEGNLVAVEAEGYAELHDDRVYDPKSHFVFEVADDGKIARVKEYFDTQLAYLTFLAGSEAADS